MLGDINFPKKTTAPFKNYILVKVCENLKNLYKKETIRASIARDAPHGKPRTRTICLWFKIKYNSITSNPLF